MFTYIYLVLIKSSLLCYTFLPKLIYETLLDNINKPISLIYIHNP